ncbi:hypothetical protein PMKS-000398 [Pichia membranifaciens]|uniref:Calcineurin-like phosphoesterase domain-containing protein n=1 Tax=Pichia membranifaciens TaxID=4926 RepID=A0A1Q2YBL5_9ASCO|nr:hypothetical protein PMKS-000398 [Pichia membranifaciens]
MENDQIRGDDSWRTFAEILDIAREQDVDMIVQGGDLFHVNAPSKKSYYHVMRALREHCWCDKPIEYKLVSDPSDAMATKHFMYPAEYDSNVNVGMPLYAISGNHDDATGEELLSPLDILSVAGLLNHYGRVIDNEQITDDIVADNASTDDEDGNVGAPVEGGEDDIMDMITEKLDDKDLIMLTKKKVSEALETLLEHDEDRSVLNKFVQAEEEDHISLLQQLSLGTGHGGGSDADSDGEESLRITDNVKDVKKSFRELAKRIKAETEYAVVNGSTNVGKPVTFTANPTASTPAAKETPRSKPAKLSADFVADSESESESEAGGANLLVDVQPPPAHHVFADTGTRRGRAHAALGTRRRARPDDDGHETGPSSAARMRAGNNSSNLDMLLGRRPK